ncbi:hypothetical protein E2562_032870 [Oryza meyeriana var. granulata]|uniref:DUF834 domain-containing protein n=1 Tax=Oryza meyeriana var. granulata TaxID=110450 RepID=A0A6G1BPL9_9ORYZ|nr:hypothetical protein E2562_032870 [Oryza meyeriana var. granulata]
MPPLELVVAQDLPPPWSSLAALAVVEQQAHLQGSRSKTSPTGSDDRQEAPELQATTFGQRGMGSSKRLDQAMDVADLARRPRDPTRSGRRERGRGAWRQPGKRERRWRLREGGAALALATRESERKRKSERLWDGGVGDSVGSAGLGFFFPLYWSSRF